MIRKLAVIAALVVLAACGQEAKKSIEKGNAGWKAFDKRQYEDAIKHFEDAVKLVSDNHNAHYGMGLSFFAQKKYEDAAKSFERAVKIKDGEAMYHMYYGVALYEAVIEEAKKRQARQEGKDPTEINVAMLDLKGANFEPALAQLETAVKQNGELYRAHYFIGRIHRHNEDAAKAAEAFTKSIEANPRYNNPYVALGELYRHWDYTDEALKVLSQGKANVPGDKERAELLFALGMAHDDKKDYAKAVEEFTAALEADKNLHKAKYQRGMAYVRMKEWTKAKTDLEQYQKNAKDEFTKGVAQKALMDIMANQR